MSALPADYPSFLAGGGEMGALIRQYDWTATALGAPAQWPQPLKLAVRLLLSSGHPMLIWWGPGLVQFYNDAYLGSIGPERHPSSLGQGARECWQETWAVIGPQIECVMSGDGSTWHENQHIPITRHGQRQDVYWTYSFSPLDDPTAPSGVGGVLVICTETTRQVLSELRWRAAEARWRALFDRAPVFMCTLAGPEHVFEYANSEYSKLIGDRSVIGMRVKDALPEVVTQGFISLLDKVYAGREAVHGAAAPVDLIHTPHGSPERRFVDFVFQPRTDETNQVVGIFVVGYDVTERVLATELLQDQDRRKDEFLAMLAHELRNPLAPIANVAQWLVQSSPDNLPTRQAGEILQRQCGQLSHLVDDLLDISRITRGTIELKREPVEVDRVIKFALESVQPSLKSKRHDLLYSPCEEALFVEGDQPRLIQCFSNVLTNAIKYTPPEGSIQVTIERADTDVCIEIADNGIGIPPEMIPRIFDLFTQADSALDLGQGGLGLGLSIVHRLIQMHAGSITAASGGHQQGSKFTIRLPLAAAPEQTLEAPPAVSDQRCRLLIVDDNIDAADSLAQLLALRGHETMAVHTGREALQRFASFAPDVALLDIGLPDIDGYELARRIRARSTAVMLVALTGYGSSEDQARSREAGFDHHLTKPVQLAELEAVIQHCQDHRAPAECDSA